MAGGSVYYHAHDFHREVAIPWLCERHEPPVPAWQRAPHRQAKEVGAQVSALPDQQGVKRRASEGALRASLLKRVEARQPEHG
jgi:hypothetical protein